MRERSRDKNRLEHMLRRSKILEERRKHVDPEIRRSVDRPSKEQINMVLPSLDRFQTYTTFSSGLNEPSIILDKTL